MKVVVAVDDLHVLEHKHWLLAAGRDIDNVINGGFCRHISCRHLGRRGRTWPWPIYLKQLELSWTSVWRGEDQGAPCPYTPPLLGRRLLAAPGRYMAHKNRLFPTKSSLKSFVSKLLVCIKQTKAAVKLRWVMPVRDHWPHLHYPRHGASSAHSNF